MSNYLKRHAKIFSLKNFTLNAIKEDVGDGDHTSLSIFPKNKPGTMRLLVKQEGVLAGVKAAKEVFKLIDKKIIFSAKLKDGEWVKKGQVAFEVKGNIQTLLMSERLVLNIMQRMSGIATHTAELMKLCAQTNASVIDTRKTTPGFRFFEKWAVVIGGGSNHRYGLFDMILIKDNHIDFAGGITMALKNSTDYLKKKKKKLKIEIEVRSLSDIKEVLKHGGADRILLDNFTPELTKKAVSLINKKVETESSGGINKNNIRKYALTGVDFISVGALTHQISSLDLSLKAVDF